MVTGGRGAEAEGGGVFAGGATGASGWLSMLGGGALGVASGG
jgi:hypothetical protein